MKEEFDIFMEKVLDEVAGQLREGFHAERKDTVKNNGVICRQVAISDGVHAAAQCIRMEPYYELYQRQGDIRVIAGDIIKTCQGDWHLEFPVQCLTEWEWAKGRLMFRLVSTGKNKLLLEDMPHHDIPSLGLSMTFYILLHASSGEGASIQVHNGHMGMWGVTGAELLECAEENTPKEMGISLESMGEILFGGAEAGTDGAGYPEPFPLYVLSNRQKLYGAACILYPGALEQAAERIGSSFYILPSSLHEVILLPADRQDSSRLGELKAIVAGVNRSDALPAEDVLWQTRSIIMTWRGIGCLLSFKWAGSFYNKGCIAQGLLLRPAYADGQGVYFKGYSPACVLMWIRNCYQGGAGLTVPCFFVRSILY